MPSIKLLVNPTFTAKVGLPVAGGPVDIEFTFKYRDRTERKAWVDWTADKSEAEVFLSMVTGWEFEEPLTEENVNALLQKSEGIQQAVTEKYFDELSGARLKNSLR